MGKQALVCVFFAACCAVAAVAAPVDAAAQAPSNGRPHEQRARPHIPSDIVVTEAHIFIIKFALQLRPEQEWHWVPIETALRDLARSQAAKMELASMEGVADRPAGGTDVATRLRRIALLARPLMKALDDGQRRKMMTLARSAGLEQLLASQ
jgi:hypothetical protein